MASCFVIFSRILCMGTWPGPSYHHLTIFRAAAIFCEFPQCLKLSELRGVIGVSNRARAQPSPSEKLTS